MSLNHLSGNLSDTNSWMNLNSNSLNVLNGINMHNSGITGCSSLNGLPIPTPFTIDLNSVNIIYAPGNAHPLTSNIVDTWQKVVDKASQLNVSQCLNIYIDDRKVSPAPIDVSHDFQSRATLYNYSYGTNSQVIITDGITISNLKGLDGFLIVQCDSKTTQSLAFNANNFFNIGNECTIKNTADSLLPCILVNGTKLAFNMYQNCSFDNSPNNTLPIVYVENSGLYFINLFDNIGNINNTIGSDVSSTVSISYDAVTLPPFPQTAVLGTLNILPTENAISVFYDDSTQLPAWSSSDVQSSLDYVKANYQKQSSTSPMTAGAISCTSLLSSGTVSCGTNSMTCGSLSSSSIAATGTISCGTNAMTSGAHNCTSLTSSGTLSCGTNSATVGNLTTAMISCTSLTASSTISCGTNALTSGSLNCTSLTSSGTMSCGANAMTCGALSCSSVNSTGLVTQKQYYLYSQGTTGQSISSATGTLVSFSQSVTNTNWGAISYPATTFTIPISGYYLLVSRISFAAAATSNNRSIQLVVNSSQVFTVTYAGVASDETRCQLVWVLNSTIGDVISLQVYQNSGLSLNISNGSGADEYSSLQLTLLNQ